MQIPLSEENIKILRKLHHHCKNKNDADHIKIILLTNNGLNQKDISELLLLNEKTVGAWIQKFRSSSKIDDWLKKNTGRIGEN